MITRSVGGSCWIHCRQVTGSEEQWNEGGWKDEGRRNLSGRQDEKCVLENLVGNLLIQFILNLNNCLCSLFTFLCFFIISSHQTIIKRKNNKDNGHNYQAQSQGKTPLEGKTQNFSSLLIEFASNEKTKTQNSRPRPLPSTKSTL